MRVFVVTLLITVCYHHCTELKACDLYQCLICDSPPVSCPACLPTLPNCTAGLPNNCTMKGLNVSTDSTTVKEGSDVTVTCTHNLTNASISWCINDELQPGEKTQHLTIKSLMKNTTVQCHANSSVCGIFNSTLFIPVEGGNDMVIILICVGAAAALLMMFAIGMKIALRRGQVRSRARKMERQQNMENIHSTVNTITSYY